MTLCIDSVGKVTVFKLKFRDSLSSTWPFALFTRNVCICLCLKLQEWVLWQQVIVFTERLHCQERNGKNQRKTLNADITCKSTITKEGTLLSIVYHLLLEAVFLRNC